MTVVSQDLEGISSEVYTQPLKYVDIHNMRANPRILNIRSSAHVSPPEGEYTHPENEVPNPNCQRPCTKESEYREDISDDPVEYCADCRFQGGIRYDNGLVVCREFENWNLFRSNRRGCGSREKKQTDDWFLCNQAVVRHTWSVMVRKGFTWSEVVYPGTEVYSRLMMFDFSGVSGSSEYVVYSTLSVQDGVLRGLS